MAVCYHGDTPDSTGKELPGRQQRLNAKFKPRLLDLDRGLQAYPGSARRAALTTNAIQAYPPIANAAIELWLASDCERAVILVWDPSAQPPAPADPGQDAEDGRGLLLVQALSLQWGWYTPASTFRQQRWQGGRVKRPCPPLAAKPARHT